MANRFWVLGTGTWDASDTTHWATTSGAGSGGASVPGTGDAVIFDASSGGGTVTVNTTVTVQSITCGAFTGTLDFSANNNNVTLSASGGFNNSGSGTRTVNLGNGTWTLTGTGNIWNFSTITGLTFNANSSSLVFTATSAGTRNVTLGASLTYNSISISGNTSGGLVNFNSSTNTIATLAVTAPNYVAFNAAATTTITNAMSVTGTSTDQIGFLSNSLGTTATVSSANSHTFTWSSFRDLTFSGGGSPTATSSFNLGHNSGITITAPASGRVVKVNDTSLVAA